MNKANFSNDLMALMGLNDENGFRKTSNHKPDAVKKRKADEISENHYEDANRELRELHFLRRQRTEGHQQELMDELSRDSEKVHVKLDQKEKTTEEKPKPKDIVEQVLPFKKDEKAIEEQKIEKLTAESVQQTLPVKKSGPGIWLSKLRNYPDDYLTENMITFEKLVSEDLKGNNRGRAKTTLQAAFFTTFGYSIDLFQYLLDQGVRIVLADDWKNPNEPKVELNFFDYPNFTLIRPPKDPTKNFQGTIHAKLMLLKFPTFLRVVVSSGNLTHDDWSILSNCIWFKDFPKKSPSYQPPPARLMASNEFNYDKDFKDTLTCFVQSLMPTQAVYSTLLNINIEDYQISDVDVVLIPSIPGRHSGLDMDKYGHRKIGIVLRKLLPSGSKQKKMLTYQTSSLGNLEEKFLKEILSSFMPSYINVEDLKSQGKKKNAPPPPSVEPASNRIRVIFPTKEYVENCLEGPQSAYCIVLNGKEYEKESFPKQIFHQFQAQENYAFHEGVVPHLKVFIVTGEDNEINDDSYMYFGSHNFSASAWGRYENNISRISIYNTELGILIPPAKGSKEKKVEMMNGVSFQFPPVRYTRGQVPWTIKYEQ